MSEEDDRIIINISGLIFETRLSTLLNFPNTLLGNSVKLNKFYVASRNEYFFDRHRLSFDAVLYYYQSGGRLHRPANVPFYIFLNELEFYGLDKEIIAKFCQNEGFIPNEDNVLPENKFQRQIWMLFEYQYSSVLARSIAIFSISIIILSTVVFCVETLPQFKIPRSNTSTKTSSDSTISISDILISNKVLFILENLCMVWFAIEYILRFAASPIKLIFFINIMNIIDLASIIPYFASLIIALLKRANVISEPISFVVLKTLRLFRIFRILKLSRYSIGLKIIGQTLKASTTELELLLFFMLVCVVVFSSAIYFAECETGQTLFRSIPDSFWWTVVTMTTVGYGDMYPVTIWGKVVGTICAIAGVLMITFPIPVIVSNFERFYHHDLRINYNQDTLIKTLSDTQEIHYKPNSNFNSTYLQSETVKKSSSFDKSLV